MRILLLLSIVFLGINLNAQDNILMMNGQIVECKIIEDFGYEIHADVQNKRGKTKRIALHKSEIFSVTKEGEKEIVIYEYDEELGNFLSIEQMRMYIQGEQDALNNFKTHFHFIGGVVLCASGAIWANGAMVYTAIAPVGYLGAQLVPKVKIREKHMSNEIYKENDIYAMGFARVARSKRITSALKGSAVGLAIGLGIVWIINE